MKAPHEFQGTSGEVTVPASAAARDSTWGAKPRSANTFLKVFTGSTSAMYWSAATTFKPSAMPAVVANSRPSLFARAIRGSTSFPIRPNSWSRVPKVTAPRISQIVPSMLSIPPRESSRSTSASPELASKPVAIADQMPFR